MSLRLPFLVAPPLASLLLVCLAAPGAPAEEPSGLVASVKEERLVMAGKLRAEIENSLAGARRTMREDPAGAEQDLKLSLDVLDRAPEIEPELRAQLRRQLQTAIRLVRRHRVEADERRLHQQNVEASAREQARLTDHTENQQQKINQIVERFNVLMDEGRFAIANQDVAPEISRIAPGSVIDSSLAFGGPALRANRENEILWRKRHDNTIRTLASIESAAIPFADDPPITFMPLEQWQDITNLRDKYKSVDVHRPGSAEQRILSELNKTTDLDVVEMPLKDVMSYLANLHGIPIVVATKKLDEAGIRLDTPVTKNLRGVTLRSALRLLLKDLELSYLIQDEVIQITTPEDAAGQLTTKVYPVGDLVVPVQPPPNIFVPGGSNPMTAGTNSMNGQPNLMNGNPAMPQMNVPRFGGPF